MILLSRNSGSRSKPIGNVSPAQHAADLRLVQSALQGDPSTTAALAERLACVPPMVRSLHRRLGGHLSHEDLHEVIQDTLISMWTKLDRFAGRSKLETWAYGFASRQVLKSLEKARRGPRRVDWNSSEFADVEAPAAPSEADYRAIHVQVDAIGPPGSDIIRMKHFDELTFEQIGDRMDMPTNSVKSRYYRSLDRLRTLLRPHYDERQR